MDHDFSKSAAGHEVDLMFETREGLYAIEVKSTQKPGAKDIANLEHFEPRKKVPVKRILFYVGERYAQKGSVELITVAALFRGK